MEPSLKIDAPAPTHNLIRLREPPAVTADCQIPSWVEAALRRTPWVVVRRGHIRAAGIPVGIRGPTRSERFAGWLAVADIADRRSPEDLWDSLQNRPSSGLAHAPRQMRTETVPALAALVRVAPILADHGYRWGPGGSVGFELATAAIAATAASDLDVILRQPRRLEPDEARGLQAALVRVAAPAPIDVILETPGGGVSLADLAVAPTRVLVRTPNGARLVADPWTAESDAQMERVL